jgi:putative oxidoreductase
MDLVVLLGRVFFGLGMAAHGAQKLFGWFSGYGLTGTGEFMVQLGFRPGRLFATLAGAGEVVSGVLLAAGLLGPLGPCLMILVMLVAAFTVHIRNGFFATKNGVEMPLLYAMAAFVLAFTGPGAYSLDNMLGLMWLSSPRNAWIAVGIAVVGAAANIVVARALSTTPVRAAKR